MSNHYFNTTYQEAAVRVTLGFNRPLKDFFLNVERLASDGTVEDSDCEEGADDGSGPIYISLYDPDVETHNLEYFREKLSTLGIEVPVTMMAAVEEDQRNNVGNYTVKYAADGTPTVLHPKEKTKRAPRQSSYLGEMSGPFGTLRVYQVSYPNNVIGIQLFDMDGEPSDTLSVNLVESVALLGAGEFFVKTWSENAQLIEPALACGLFEDTGRRGPIVGMTGVRAPIWRIRSVARPTLHRTDHA